MSCTARYDLFICSAVLRVDNSSTSTYTDGREAREVKRREDECSVSQPLGQSVSWLGGRCNVGSRASDLKSR